MNARAVTAAFAVLALALFLSACNKEDQAWQGWVEASLIFVAPDEVGRVQTLAVREGDSVSAGDPLFTVDDDLQKADVAQNQALVENAQLALERARALVKTSAGTQKALDDAEAALRTAQARLNSAQTRLARRKIVSPVTGSVQQIYFRPGEMVPAGRPVLALLPPGNIKVRFFVPEAMLPHIAYGDRVRIGCDGCPADLTARVSFIAKQAEYTPPVIYSLEERAKLVFLIEALPDKPDNLRVGQPVDVRLIAPAPPSEPAK
jgi:HlyD family secretion protein